MKKILIGTLAACLSALLCGCSLWLDGEYSSVTPHLEDNIAQQQDSVVVESYDSLCLTLTGLIENGNQDAVIYMPGFAQEELDSYMAQATEYVWSNNAIGAYAVNDITYEIGTNAGNTAIAVKIAYLHNRSEILRIRQANTMEDAVELITDALDNCDAGVVLKVAEYEQIDFTQLVQDYVEANPQTCMELPQVAAMIYPESGTERVVEINFTYQTSREALRSMQQTVAQVFASAKLYVSGDAENWEKYAQLYSFLMERYQYTLQTSITPSYSLLRHGVGDSKAFATVYAAMCRQAGLDCQVVSGTRAGEAWYWNMLLEDGVYYHVDLLRCSSAGGFRAKTEEEMSGYVWDYSAYTIEEETQPRLPEDTEQENEKITE